MSTTATPLPQVPNPQGGASLMIAMQCNNKKVVVVGNTTIAASRVLASLEADAAVSLVGPIENMCSELVYRIEQKQIQWLGSDFDVAYLDENLADLVFVCVSDRAFATPIAQACRARRIPINVTDANDLCDFFMTSTYRDQSLQIAVSTNGLASKLSNRIRRHVAASLPANLGDAVRRVGLLRHKVRCSDPSSAASGRRMKWLAQICEYWSMDRLAQLSDRDMEDLLEAYHHDEGYESIGKSERLASLGAPPRPQQQLQQQPVISQHEQPLKQEKQGVITLVGAGTGDPDLLTMAAHRAIEDADLVLADKIVPAEVVALVKCELKISRKFPGNADAAQEEFNQMALVALKQGKRVVRLKQGDPYLFGRGGEEVLHFRKLGYTPQVIPGISSSYAAPLLAGIPLTHRSVASQFLVTTGTGAKNSTIPLPTFDAHRTDVFLMAIHRLSALTQDLIGKQKYPADVPCAIIERASCKDQRIVWGSLQNIVQLLDSVGGSRPPGLLVVGYAINVLKEETKHGSQGVASTFLSDLGGADNVLQLHDPESVC
ncbi:tetrapyrrole methylase [Zychaea mexicana]|uniref:tetrapyrrole methylase n=1 Tax=Zychaea mexicana TaxID=64656 RepID=UPI0022FE23C3|nr:tetrapyrrole methylase [Zychaea mexicana]KAI9491577.1 tetrapyrrole methylase [Zychaea mexicana]